MSSAPGVRMLAAVVLAVVGGVLVLIGVLFVTGTIHLKDLSFLSTFAGPTVQSPSTGWPDFFFGLSMTAFGAAALGLAAFLPASGTEGRGRG